MAATYSLELLWPCRSGLHAGHALEAWVDPGNEFTVLDVFVLSGGRRCRVTRRLPSTMLGVIEQTAKEGMVERGERGTGTRAREGVRP